jgi:hypothetical protein
MIPKRFSTEDICPCKNVISSNHIATLSLSKLIFNPVISYLLPKNVVKKISVKLSVLALPLALVLPLVLALLVRSVLFRLALL